MTKKIVTLFTIVMMPIFITACSTEKSRAVKCQEKGMDKQTCYLSEQMYQQHQENMISDAVGIGIISSIVK